MQIVVTGPESTGKTTLCQALGAHYNVIPVWEYSREYLISLGRNYSLDDLYTIALKQNQLIRENSLTTDIKFADTDWLTIYIWAMLKFPNEDISRFDFSKEFASNFYLLMQPDLPWVFDPLREHPDDRQMIFSIYWKELYKRNLPFLLVSGCGRARFNSAIFNIEDTKLKFRKSGYSI